MLLSSLPLSAVAVVNAGAVAEGNLLWREDFEDAEKITDAFDKANALGLTLAASTTDSEDKVAQLALKGMAPEKYYLVDYNGKYAGALSGYTLSADQKSLTGGSATVNKKTYTGVQGTINTAKYSTAAKDDAGGTLSGFYICTGELADARCGAFNTARPIYFNHPAVTLADAEAIVLEMKLYLPAGARADKTINSHLSATKTTDGSAVSVALFALVPNGKTATLGVTDKSTYVRGKVVTLALEAWYRLTFVVDPETSVLDVFVDGKYAYSAKNNSTGTLAEINAPINITKQSWYFQFNRLGLPENLAKYFQIDDVAIYTSMDDLGLYMGEDFEAYAGSIGKTPTLGTSVHKGALYAADPLKPDNVVVKLPFDALKNDTEILMRMSGGFPVENGYYVVTRNAENGAVEVEGKTVNVQSNGKYTVVDGENNYTDVMLATLKDYYDYWGGDGTVDQNWKLNHYGVDYRIQKKAIFSADYYLSEDARGRFAGQLHSYQTSETATKWLYLYSVDAGKGTIGIGQSFDDATIVKGAWNNVTLEVDLATGNADLYVNGAFVKSGSLGVTNLSFDANNWSFCKVFRKVNPYYGSFAGYFMVDNVQLRHEKTTPLILDPDGLMYVEVNGERLFTNTLYLPYGADYRAVYFDAAKYQGMLTTENKNSIRLTIPTGLRFATRIDKALLDELFALVDDGSVTGVEFGTMVAPSNYITSDFKMSVFDEEGKRYLKILATRDSYFPYDDDENTTHFVGSIVNFYEENVPKSFAGRGFVEVTLKSGQKMEIYSDYTQNATVVDVAQKALDSNHVWSDSAKAILKLFAAGKQPALSERAQMVHDLSNLNVLAIGDSHFNGSDTQWITLQAKESNWNLTNLGKSGWTVACNPEAYPEGERVRNSMYDYLYNSASYVYGSTNANYYTYGDTTGKTAADVDLILFEGGWNDFMWGIPLGEVDSKDGSTLQGARNLILQKLLKDYPDAKIVLLTEWHRDGSCADGESRLEFVSDSLKELYEKNYANNDRVVLIDAGDPAVSGVDMTDSDWCKIYAPDATHLNEEGMKIFAENILPYLWKAYTGK